LTLPDIPPYIFKILMVIKENREYFKTSSHVEIEGNVDELCLFEISINKTFERKKLTQIKVATFLKNFL
jgi:hypothetical protein